MLMSQNNPKQKGLPVPCALELYYQLSVFGIAPEKKPELLKAWDRDRCIYHQHHGMPEGYSCTPKPEVSISKPPQMVVGSYRTIRDISPVSSKRTRPGLKFSKARFLRNKALWKYIQAKPRLHCAYIPDSTV